MFVIISLVCMAVQMKSYPIEAKAVFVEVRQSAWGVLVIFLLKLNSLREAYRRL